jgi:hypothetical protein
MSQSVIPFKLPHDAVGFDLGDLAIEFRPDKMVLVRRLVGDHYTIQLGAPSGVLDVHRTWRDDSGQQQHKTVFAMHRSDIPKLIRESSPATSGLFSFRRLRLGWLARNEIAIARGLELGNIEDIAQVTRKARRKRLVLDEAKFRAQLQIPEYLEEVWDFPDGQFSLLRGGRRIGVGIKLTDQFGEPWLYWIKFRGLVSRSNPAWDQIAKAAMRYAIPPEKYGAYCFLCP